MKKINKPVGLLLLLSAFAMAASEMRYIEKGADIIDIGKEGGYEEIVVPQQIIEYEPTLNQIDNAIYYESRVVVAEDCVIDELEHEYCPIDKEECAEEFDYLLGSSELVSQTKIADPFCTGNDTEKINSSNGSTSYLECYMDEDKNFIPDRASVSLPQINSFEAIDTVDGEGDWDTTIVPGAVVQRKNPGAPTFFVYSPTTNERDNMVIEGDLSVNTTLATENPGDDDWIGFVFGFEDKNNYHYISWRRDPASLHEGSVFTGFTLGEVTNGTIPFSTSDTTSHKKLQRETNIYGWENGGNYKVKIVYNTFFVKAYIAKYDSAGNIGAYTQVIDYNPSEPMDIKGKMGFMNHSNGGSVYKNFKADFCPVGYAVDGNNYQCKQEPECDAYYDKVRTGDVGVVRCEMKYDYYNYTCPDEPNAYGNNYYPKDPGGDCGHVTCTNGSTPPNDNCLRQKHVCPVNPDSVCVSEEKELDYNDFTKWEVQNFRNAAVDATYVSNGRTYRYSDWNVIDENTVVQNVNGQPTWFLSNYELKNGHITMEGLFKTDDPGDNDWFGFVFGFKNQSDYYLLDWSRGDNDIWRIRAGNTRTGQQDASGNPINGGIPLTLSKISADAGALNSNLWYHEHYPPAFNVLERDNNGGWEKGQVYRIKLDLSANDIKVWIGKEGEAMTLDIDYHSDTPMDISGKLGFYNYSISLVTYRDFIIEWEDGKDIQQVQKRVLGVPTVEGEFKGAEYGNIRGYDCEENCKFSLSEIYGNNNELCFKDRVGSEGCFEFSQECEFSGTIKETTLNEIPLYSFLNSSGESIPNYTGTATESYGSPTGIALNFNDIRGTTYPLEQIKESANVGDKITVDFWLNWDGLTAGMPVGFDRYDLWFSQLNAVGESGKFAFGFNTASGDVYGIPDASFMANGWHRVTAVFTHGAIDGNKLYIDGVPQTLSQQRSWRNTPNLANTNITKTMNLSGWSASANYTLGAKIAGLNVYDGELNSQAISRLGTTEYYNGISYIKVGQNKIEGFDANNTALGGITSSCKLSGKVGDHGKTIEVPIDNTYTKVYDEYKLSFSGRTLSGGLCSQHDTELKFDISNIDEVLSATLYETKFDDYIGIWVNGTLVRVGPYGGDRLHNTWDYRGALPITSRDGYASEEICKDNITEQRVFCQTTLFARIGASDIRSCEQSKIWQQSHDINVAPYLRQGENTILIRTLVAGGGYAEANFKIATLRDNVRCGSECTLDNLGMVREEVITNTDMVEKTVADPIVAAKVVNGRIEFWDSFTRGPVGHIEPLKYVKSEDISDGFTHEFADFDTLYNKGFTAFTTSDNNITYAVSNEPMTARICLENINGTDYFLSDRNLTDEVEMSILKAITPYLNGEFRDYCVVEKNGAYSNYFAEYSIKETLKEKVYETYVCSPWSCESHQCSTASCKEEFIGTLIKEQDKPAVLNSTICIDQVCDGNEDYFAVCGNENGCPSVAGVYQLENGSCVQSGCPDDMVMNTVTGKCEKYGCKDSIERDGRCYKSL